MNRTCGEAAARHARAREHGRDRVQERRGAEAPRRGCPTRRLQTAALPADGVRLEPEPPRRVPPRAADAVARARTAAPAHRRVPLLLRADAGPASAAVPDPACAAQAGRLPLRRLRHPRQDTGAARLHARGRRARRRLVRRDPLGSRRRGDPARHRPAPLRALAWSRRRASARRPRALAQGEQGHRVRRGRVRRAARRPRRRPRPAARRGRRALPPRGHRGRPAERRLVRDLRDRGDGARQARRHLSPRRGGPPHRGGVRHPRCRS